MPCSAQKPTHGRVAIITAPRQVTIETRPLPEPEPQQLRIRLHGCGVCASNLPIWEGRSWFHYPQEPGAPGHEGWGVVDAVGSDVTRFQPGDAVAFLAHHSYAEYDLADMGAVIAIPTEYASSSFPAEPLGCAINIFRRSDIRAGQTVAIVGIGFLGALLTQLCLRAGAKVIAISRRQWSLDLASKLGAQHVVSCEDFYEAQRQVREWTCGRGCERVIEATGLQLPLTLAGELVAVRGRLIIAGYHQDGTREVNLQSWNWRGIDVINAHERDPTIYHEGMSEAIAAISRGDFDPQSLFTHRFPLERLGDALEITAARPDGFLKALIEMP